MPDVGTTLDVLVEKPAAGGEMLARVDGRIVFVSGAIPGERVTARVDRVAKQVAHATAVGILEPSPDRRDAPGDPLCGGCLYGHIRYPRQLAIKSQVIADAFARIGKIPLEAPVPVAASPEEGYRMRARLHARGQRLGFFREGTHEVCDARQTRQLLPEACDALDRLMAAARSLGPAALDAIREVELSENVDASQRVVSLETTQPLDVRSLEMLTLGDGFTHGPFVTDTLTIDEKPLTLRRHVLAFFQGNRHLLRDLVAHVAAAVPQGTTLADLYAGVGLFAVAVAVARDATVVAVEGDRYAAEDLHANAAGCGARVATIRGDVESFRSPLPTIETVIVDPPRTGMTPAALDRVVRLRAARVIYVSCDVATLARDARRLLNEGYRIGSASAFDLFPNTPHVETVVRFDRG